VARPEPGPDRDGDPGAGPGAAPARDPAPARQARRTKRPSGGVAVVAGGLLQDLEDRLRRDLAPVEERVRSGEEVRGLAGAPGGIGADPLVIVLPTRSSGPTVQELDGPS
jgi:hypothetical protein